MKRQLSNRTAFLQSWWLPAFHHPPPPINRPLLWHDNIDLALCNEYWLYVYCYVSISILFSVYQSVEFVSEMRCQCSISFLTTFSLWLQDYSGRSPQTCHLTWKRTEWSPSAPPPSGWRSDPSKMSAGEAECLQFCSLPGSANENADISLSSGLGVETDGK